MFRFESPLAFALLIFLPLILEWRPRWKWLGAGQGDESSSLVFSSRVNIAHAPGSRRIKLRGPVLSVLQALAFAFLVIAFARPQQGNSYAEIQSLGRDILFVLDTSGSMRALDFHIDGERVTRLEALQSVVGSFIRERQGDRMGLVVFGSEVFTQCPLTKDIGVLAEFVSNLEIGMAGEGTALGDGAAIGLKRLRDIETNSKVLVLVTDGLQTAGKMNPLDAAAIAKQMGVKIYSIGIGGVGAAPFQTRTLFGFETLTYKDVPLDVTTLTKMAETTGGKYFHAKSTEELRAVYEEIDSLEERIETKFEHIEYEERYWWFLLTGMTLFFIAEVLRTSYFRVFPG